MISPSQNGIYLSHLDEKLTWAGWHVYMDENIAGMKPFKCLTSYVFECLHGNFSSHPPPRWDGSGTM